jgi:hypothetical protein
MTAADREITMFHTVRNAVIVRLGALAIGLTLARHRAEAQVESFAVTSDGHAPMGLSIFGADSPHSATGRATHMRRYSGDGVANALSFDPATGSGTFKGRFVFVAGNGDRLACTYGDTSNGAKEVGTFQVYDAGYGNIVVAFIAEFNPIPSECTGRFQDVIYGSFLMLALTDPFPLQIDQNGFTPPFDYTWEGEGWLEFGEGGH